MTLVLMLKTHHTSHYVLCVLSFQRYSFIGELPTGVFLRSRSQEGAYLLIVIPVIFPENTTV